MKIGYHRVSSATQSLELGREALITAGVPESRIYEEKVSGKSRGNRPELKAMLKALQPNDEVIVHKLDRLCRNAKDLLTIGIPQHPRPWNQHRYSCWENDNHGTWCCIGTRTILHK